MKINEHVNAARLHIARFISVHFRIHAYFYEISFRVENQLDESLFVNSIKKKKRLYEQKNTLRKIKISVNSLCTRSKSIIRKFMQKKNKENM